MKIDNFSEINELINNEENVIIPKKIDIITIEDNMKKFKERKKIEKLEDYDKVRKNLLNIIEEGIDLFHYSKQMAIESDSSRNYEAAGNILKIIIDANKTLIDIHPDLDILDIEKENEMELSNNNLSISTKELLEIVLEKRKMDKNNVKET